MRSATKIAAGILATVIFGFDLGLPPCAMASELTIQWEVKGRFRLFRYEEDFDWVAKVHRDANSILSAERALAKETNGRGWAAHIIEYGLCIDPVRSRLLEKCRRGPRDEKNAQEEENYLSPDNHRVEIRVNGVAPDATCVWSFVNSSRKSERREANCEPIDHRVKFKTSTMVSVVAQSPGALPVVAETTIEVRDILLAGIGDSTASGEGNPDTAIALGNAGFCFQRLGGAHYYRPKRNRYDGVHHCDFSNEPNDRQSWLRWHAHWMSAACHRSLYGHQLRAALMLAVKNPKISVTFIPLGCTGATIDEGVLGPQRAREIYCEGSGKNRVCTPKWIPAQLTQLRDAISAARKIHSDRTIDLLFITVGANDLGFSGMVADIIISEESRERKRTKSMISTISDARQILRQQLPSKFKKMRAELGHLMNGRLSRVIFVSYANPALHEGGKVCPATTSGFDIHPAFRVNQKKLETTSAFVESEMLPTLKMLAKCEGEKDCADPATNSMTFVESHQDKFGDHGFCAQSTEDPSFDRDCFDENGASFEDDPVKAADVPLRCGPRASQFRAYESRTRWIRTPNDSYFAAMTFPEIPGLQPHSIHDAVWGIASAVYGGAIHPTAEGQSAMADAAYPDAARILQLD